MNWLINIPNWFWMTLYCFGAILLLVSVEVHRRIPFQAKGLVTAVGGKYKTWYNNDGTFIVLHKVYPPHIVEMINSDEDYKRISKMKAFL